MTKAIGHSMAILGAVLVILFTILWLTIGTGFVNFIGLLVTIAIIMSGVAFNVWYWFIKVKTL